MLELLKLRWLMKMEKLLDIETKLIELTDRQMVLNDGYCKGEEPSISVGIGRDLKWWAEIYSYLLEFPDSHGRHHYANADTYEKLIFKLDIMVKFAEKKLEELEERCNKGEFKVGEEL